MYNDELPNGTTSSEAHAHAKGVVVFNEADGQGFWMLHSIPHYPPAPSGEAAYSFPATGIIYGQTIICVSLPIGQANLVGPVERKLFLSDFFLNSYYDCDMECQRERENDGELSPTDR